MNTYRELLLGCGHRRDKRFGLSGRALVWQNVFTLDINDACEPDFVADLDQLPIYVQMRNGLDEAGYERLLTAIEPDTGGGFKADLFDEIHAYEVFEHLGWQGNAGSFFTLFSELYRILKPGGHIFATCPSRYSPWLWGDPSHRRAILPESLIFLQQPEYTRQLDCPEAQRTPMSDFRRMFQGDFDVIAAGDNHVTFTFALRAVKPSRCTQLWGEPHERGLYCDPESSHSPLVNTDW